MAKENANNKSSGNCGFENDLWRADDVLHGADRDRPGAFESAAGGTLFLDEVGECDLETPAKLLRVLPSPSGAGSGFRTIRRVGDHREIPVDVRVIAATNRDLYETISAGTFREDLVDRLSGFSITLPPLRELRRDIPHITDRLLTQINPQFEQEKSGDILQPLISKQLLRKVLGSGVQISDASRGADLSRSSSEDFDAKFDPSVATKCVIRIRHQVRDEL